MILASAGRQEAGGWNATGIANGGMSLSFLGQSSVDSSPPHCGRQSGGG